MNNVLAYLIATNQLDGEPDMTLEELLTAMNDKLTNYNSTKAEAVEAIQAVILKLQEILASL